jgi:hypothetical protein
MCSYNTIMLITNIPSLLVLFSNAMLLIGLMVTVNSRDNKVKIIIETLCVMEK